MIPGFIISILTFPGVIVHEFAHVLFCKLRGIAVLDVCYFQVGNPAGYVIHGEIDDFNTSFLVCVGPFIVNTLLCALICFPALIPMQVFGVTEYLSYFLLWLGVSIGMHAFPSTQDASNLFVYAKKAASEFNVFAILTLPLVGVIYIANILSFFWVDFFYGMFIGIGLPAMLL